MAKARREVTENLKFVDVVLELLDARIPLSSQNPMIDELVQHKRRLILLNKSDLADQAVTERWIEHFSKENTLVLPINSQKGSGVKEIPQAVSELAKPITEKMKARGMKPRAIRAMILGIPNVGKSTLINRLASKRIAKIGDRPGITKQQQWIKVGRVFELLDTPGILWPKFASETIGLRLAATGAIRDEVFDFQTVALFMIRFFKEHYPEKLSERYSLNELANDDVQIFDEIGRNRHFLLSGGMIDYDKVAETVIREFRAGLLGRISLEFPEHIER